MVSTKVVLALLYSRISKTVFAIGCELFCRKCLVKLGASVLDVLSYLSLRESNTLAKDVAFHGSSQTLVSSWIFFKKFLFFVF